MSVVCDSMNVGVVAERYSLYWLEGTYTKQ